MKIGFDAKRAIFNETGLGNYSRTLIHSLKKYYSQHFYVLFSPVPRKGASLLRAEEFQDFSLCTPKGFLLQTLHPLWRSFFIGGDIQKQNLDIYHGLSAELPWNIPSGVKKVVTIHDLIFMKFPEWYGAIDAASYTKKVRFAAETADMVVAISENTKKDIIEYLKIDPIKIKVVYQSVNPLFEKLSTKSETDEVRSKYSLNNPYVLYVGSFNSRKNLETLVKAFSFLKGVELCLLGKGEKVKKGLQEIAQKIGCQDEIRFLENIPNEDLPALYRGALFSAYPSLYEGFGIPVIESLFQETPVVLSGGGVFSEAAGPGGYYCDVTDVDDLAKAMNELAGDKELRKKLAMAGKKYMRRFTQEAAANAMMQAYTDLADLHIVRQNK